MSPLRMKLLSICNTAYVIKRCDGDMIRAGKMLNRQKRILKHQLINELEKNIGLRQKNLELIQEKRRLEDAIQNYGNQR